ncbi:MAG: hypothetical protein D6780_01835 [Candidatus Dadabacteria bacterium]|nr:MAG: hypothetical protein D6780_01835 [Candidatus Dadabacteria bacterium]
MDLHLTSKKRQFVVKDKRFNKQSLSFVLKELMPDIPSSEWAERLDYGGVFLNGRPVFEDRKVETPFRLEYYMPLYNIKEAEKFFPAVSKKNIVYKDSFLAVVFKPAALPTLPTCEQRKFHLKRYLEELFYKGIHIPSRLDTSTSGILPVSLQPDFHPVIQRLFERRLVEKTYLFASCFNSSWESIEERASISKSFKHPVLREGHSFSGQKAVTFFKKAGVFYSPLLKKEVFLYIAKPLTGRTHQIRVHAKVLGVPIIGDTFYFKGDPSLPLHLVCFSLSFWKFYDESMLRITVPERLYPNWLKNLDIKEIRELKRAV